MYFLTGTFGVNIQLPWSDPPINLHPHHVPDTVLNNGDTEVHTTRQRHSQCREGVGGRGDIRWDSYQHQTLTRNTSAALRLLFVAV